MSGYSVFSAMLAYLLVKYLSRRQREFFEYLFPSVSLILFFTMVMYVSFYGKGSTISYSVAGFFTGYVFLVFLTVLFTQDLEWF